MVNNREEVVRRYQRKPEFKEYKRKYHLRKVKEQFINMAHEKYGNRKKVRIFVEEIEHIDNVKDVRDKAKYFFGKDY